MAATMFEWSAEEKGDYTHGVSKNVLGIADSLYYEEKKEAVGNR